MSGPSSSPAYTIQVFAGPNYTDLAPVHVNCEARPLAFTGPHFSGYCCVRVKNYTRTAHDSRHTVDGLKEGECICSECLENPPTDYFAGRNRQYAFTIQGKFSQDWSADDVMLVVDADTPIRKPYGISIALSIAKWYNPLFEVQTEGASPWIRWPLVTFMPAIGVYAKGAEGHLIVPNRPSRSPPRASLNDGAKSDPSLYQSTGSTTGSFKDGIVKRLNSWMPSFFGAKSDHHQSQSRSSSRRNSGHWRSPSSTSSATASKSMIPSHHLPHNTDEDSPSLTKSKSGTLGGGGAISAKSSVSVSDVTSTSSLAAAMSHSHKPISIPNNTSSTTMTPVFTPPPVDTLGHWEFGDIPVVEDTSRWHTSRQHHYPTGDAGKRCAAFRDRGLREGTRFRAREDIYCFEFYDAHFDFQSMALKLPGVTLNGAKYWDGQPLRFVAKSRDNKTVFFVVSFVITANPSK